MRRARVRAAVLAASMGGGVGCSLVFGWADLQGGAALGDSGVNENDGTASGDGASGDGAGNGGDADAGGNVRQGLTCGSATCALADGCCFSDASPQPTCGDARACAADYIECQLTQDCNWEPEDSGAKLQLCCRDGDASTTRCKVTRCGVGEHAACDPTATNPCGGGGMCRPVAPYGFYECS